MYRAVFIDMDGTLLKKDHSISEWNKKVIQQLTNKSILVVIVSARPLHGIAHLIKDIIKDNVPVVSLNGSYIFYNNEIIYQKTIAVNDAENVYEQVRHCNLSAMFYSQMEWFAISEDELTKKEQRITDVKIIIRPFEQIKNYWQINNTGPNKILIAGNENDIALAEQKLLSVYAGKLNIYKSQPRYLEVMNIDASKVKAIQFLMDKYNIERSEVIAIGDNYNDKEMIEFAGAGIAMGNAPDDIKAIADYVTDSNNEDGVAKALTFFFHL